MWLLLSAALALDGQASASKEKKPAQPVVLTEEEKEIVLRSVTWQGRRYSGCM